MSDDIAIKVEHVGKTFHEQMGARSLKQVFLGIGHKIIGKKEDKLNKGEFTALKDINFEVKKGEFFGIVGRNGCGKSTLLKIIAGVYSPTKGAVTINGKLTPFIELGVGFNPELSGRDNVFLNGALLGFTRKQMEEMYDDIVEFAELKEFMDVKLKNYSSGMQVRLAFSVAIRAQSDILLIDEVLAVGDAAFQRKCFNYFGDLKRSGQTVILITHEMDIVRRYCDRAIMIEKGIVAKTGTVSDVAYAYTELFINEYIIDKSEKSVKDMPYGISPASGIDKNYMKINKVWIENAKATTVKNIDELDDVIHVCIRVTSIKALDNFIPGVIVANEQGDFLTVSNSYWCDDINKVPMRPGDTKVAKFIIPNIYETGDYTVSVNVVSNDLGTFYDWKNDAAKIRVKRKHLTGGKVNPKYNFEVIA